MVRKISLCLMVLIIFTITVSAEMIVTTSNPPNYFVGQWFIDTYVPNKWQFNVRAYDEDQEPPYSGLVSMTGAHTSQGVVAFWISKLEPETYYHFSIPLELEESSGIETGNLLKSAIQFMTIVPDQTFVNLPIAGNSNQFPIDPISPLPAQYYDMFYDVTSKMLSAVFYIPDEWARENQEAMMHSYIMVSLGSNVLSTSNTILTGRKVIDAKGIYTDVLQEIRTLITELQATQNGLTQEQVKDAIIEALEQVIEAEGMIGQDAVDSAEDQLESFVETIYGGITETINGYYDAAENVYLAAWGSSAKEGKLIFPAIKAPMPGIGEVQLSNSYEVDLVAGWRMLPEPIRTLITLILTITICYNVIAEALDTFNTVLIHRELLGMSEDDLIRNRGKQQ